MKGTYQYVIQANEAYSESDIGIRNYIRARRT